MSFVFAAIVALIVFVLVFATYIHYVAYYSRRDKSRFVVALTPSLRTLAYLNAIAKVFGVTGAFTIDDVLREAKKKSGLNQLSDEQQRRIVRLLDARIRHAKATCSLWTANLGRFRDSVSQVTTQLHLHDMRVHNSLPQPSKPIQRIFITGLLRSGTTHMHSLMASNGAAFQFIPFWQMRHPLPLPKRDVPLHLDPRAAADRKIFADFPLPGHKLDADGPEEDWNTHIHSLFADPLAVFGMYDDGPLRELCKQNQQTVDLAAVVDYCDLFRGIASQRNPNAPSLWICKDPVMPMFMKQWLATFDALGDAKRFVWLHRDPNGTIESLMSLEKSSMEFVLEYADYKTLASMMIDELSNGLRQMLAFRDSLSADEERATFIDVSFSELQQQPLATLRKVYAFIGIEFDSVAESAANAYLAANPKEQSTHRYDAAEFGLSKQAIDEKFKFYTDRFRRFVCDNNK